MSDSDLQAPFPALSSPLSIRRRVPRMAAAWAILGALMGAGLASKGGGVIGVVAVVVAGIIEMALIGAVFALIGGRPLESLLGAMCGATVGLMLGVVGGDADLAMATTFGLVVGAITGATLRPYLRLLCLPVLLLNRVLPAGHRWSRMVRSSPGR